MGTKGHKQRQMNHHGLAGCSGGAKGKKKLKGEDQSADMWV
jgi:hypothetical protein